MENEIPDKFQGELDNLVNALDHLVTAKGKGEREKISAEFKRALHDYVCHVAQSVTLTLNP